jgi:beta-mannanase
MRTLSRALIIALLAGLAVVPSVSAARAPMALGIGRSAYKTWSDVDTYKRNYGRYPAIWTVWSDWGAPSGSSSFPATFMSKLRSHGIVPMVNWEPLNPSKQGDCAHWALDNIINGDHDAYIRKWAQAAKAYGGKILMRFGHEMNGYWFIWGAGRCDNTAAKFVSAWRHVWNIFRGSTGVGATNVRFVWSPYRTNFANFFPGDSYVDFLGTTAFSWGPKQWLTMVEALAPSIKALGALPSAKPIIAAEVGAAPYKDCASCKYNWILNGYPAVYDKWWRVVAIVYLDVDMRFNDQPNWRLNSPTNAFRAYQLIAADPRFKGYVLTSGN